MFKNELQTRKVSIEAEVIMLRKSQVVEEIILLDKIRRNQTRKQEVQKELEKKQISVERQWNSLYRRKNLCSKQLENTKVNPTRKL